MRTRTKLLVPALLTIVLNSAVANGSAAATAVTPDEARVIAKEATIYGFPLVDNYRIQYAYFVDRSSKEYKAPWNHLHNDARVYTPEDRAVQTPNSDTPYSQLGADLRGEPLVITVPAIEEGRYYSLQFIDMYCFNFAYVGSRATGNGPGSYLLAGPRWRGTKPRGIKSVIRSETDFAFVLYRTQLFGPEDIGNVRKVQAGYRVQTLSEFLGGSAPPAPPRIEFPRPLSAVDQRVSPEFFRLLDFVLQFCPTHSSERQLRARFAKLGIGTGRFDVSTLAPETRKAMQAGMADAWSTFQTFQEQELATGGSARARFWEAEPS
jgi:hypothetical protein